MSAAKKVVWCTSVLFTGTANLLFSAPHISITIKTHGCVSAAKKAVWRTSVLFTGTANSPFSAPRISITIKTHGRVSVAKKAVWRTSVLFTGTTNSPFSAPHISITTRPISIKFTYFMPSTYATPHTKFKRNWSSSLQDMCSWKLPYFLHLFLLLRTILQSNFEPTKNTLPVDRFLSNLAHLLRHFVVYLSLKFGDV